MVYSLPHKSNQPDVSLTSVSPFPLSLSPQISVPLSTAFGADTEGAQWIVGYLLEKVINNLSVWSAEAELANDTVGAAGDAGGEEGEVRTNNICEGKKC